MSRVEDLEQILKTANDAYRLGDPIMSDLEFDNLEQELRVLSPNHSWFDKAVNDEIPLTRKISLPFPMMSLNKVKNIDTLFTWAQSYPEATFILTPKFDGLSVGSDGQMSWTRGNGHIGQICTQHTSHIPSIHTVQHHIVRGEIIFTHNNWIQFKQLHPEASSSRNSATGLINGDYDANRSAEYQLLDIMLYDILDSDKDKEEQLKILNNNVFVKIADIQTLTEDYLFELYSKWKKDYPLDGIVIEVNESKYRIGTESNGNPSFAIAYKSPVFNETREAIVKEIERNVNRHGIVTPVVVLEEPIFLSGAWINRVSANNMRFIFDWDIYPKEKITITRSGEVIPKIIAVGNTSIPFREMYTKNRDYLKAYNEAIQKRWNEEKSITHKDKNNLLFCPSCNSFCSKDAPEDTWHQLICTNPKCKGKELDSVVKFFTIAQIDGFADKKIEQIYNAVSKENTNEPHFLKVLNVNRQTLSSLDGWAETSVDKFINETKRIKNSLSYAQFLHATGWFGELGEKTLQKIIDNDGWNIGIQDLIQIDGVQEKIASMFIKGKCTYYMYENFLKEFSFVYEKSILLNKEGKLSGFNICMTGFRDKGLSQQIQELGGNVSDNINKQTNCLITKDKNSTSSKILKAQKLGITIYNIDEFKNEYIL